MCKRPPCVSHRSTAAKFHVNATCHFRQQESRTEAEMRMELTTCMERLRSELQDQIADIRGRAVFNVQSLLEELQARFAFLRHQNTWNIPYVAQNSEISSADLME